MELATTSPIPLPAPVTPISIRPAHLGDLPFIDSLQKMHTKMVGWMPTKQLEGKIAAGHVLVAEEGLTTDYTDCTDQKLNSSVSSGPSVVKNLLGYCISRDQYFKRDDVGIIYQLNVLPTHQRGLIGAHLLKAVFERAAYGCRLFCCWCAQDIAANRFWESMGFVPLAFRAGGTARGQKAEGRGQKENARVHIFWQKRIREGDETTPWWFPCKTDSGSIREDRLVLPIPPGVMWNDQMPVILPSSTGILPVSEGAGHGQDARGTDRRQIANRKSEIANRQPAAARPPLNMSCGLRTVEEIVPPPRAKAKRPPREKVKCDPRLIAAARELRDRWLEQVNGGQAGLLELGKYAVARALPARDSRGKRIRRLIGSRAA